MYPLQAALLAAEALVMALLVFGLFRSRGVTGRSPLYVVLGGLQYLAASSPLRVEVAPGWSLQPAAVAVFGVTLMAVLLVYVTEEHHFTRRLVNALALGNAGLTLVALVIGQHLRVPGGELPFTVTAGVLWRDAALALARSTSLYVFLIGVVVVYEFLSRFLPWLVVRAAVAMAAVAALEAVLFTTLASWGRPETLRFAAAEVAGGVGVASVFALLLWGYVRLVEPVTNAASGTGELSDVLQELKQARSRMTRDALTGVHNRGYFDESFARAVAHATRYKEHLCVLIVDADHFKSINDRHSHLTGDEVLKLLARTLLDGARSSDIVCRYGGDEFVVILPNATIGSAQTFAQRFQQSLRERARASTVGLASLEISATVGVASLLEDGAAVPQDLLRLADNRLYVGKRAGRDRVVWRDVPVSSVQ